MMTDPDTTGSSGLHPVPIDAPWHRLGGGQVLERLGSGDAGLTAAAAAARLAEVGRNELEDKGAKRPITILWEQLTAVMVLILIGASLLSLVLGKFLEAGAIGAIVVLFALLGFVQEYRAERAIAALRKMAVPTVRVTRDGTPSEIPAADLVPGDLVHLEAGTVVPADMRLVETANLRIQEATLTGESEPVDKHVDVLDRDDLALGDRRNMGYSGTQVTYGRGRGVVVATGMRTELGRIASLLQAVDASRTPLQERLDKVGKQLALVGVAVAGLVVLMGALAGEPASDLVLTAISVAVAVIPEGLPAVVTFTLAIGAQRMLRRNALIRKLPAVETLGSVTTICSDKTGTLTENRMTVTVVDVAGHHLALHTIDTAARPVRDAVAGAPTSLAVTLAAGVLCNDADARSDGHGGLAMIGDPTETALLQVAHDGGIDIAALRALMPRTGEHPFDSDRKRMSTVHAPAAGRVPELAGVPQDVSLAFVKGAVDGLLPLATHVWDDDGPVALTDSWRDRIRAANDAMASDGMRVLGVAFRAVEGAAAVDETESGLTLLGLVGIIDPPRAEVRDAVATCRAAGIRPVMITGDHPLTARAIARDLGITTDDRVLTGMELERLDDAAFDQAVREVSVFARVSPEHKLRIVRSLQAQGDVVAMTGDGVNDAPALKRADIGVAMGITGTDVSKEASDMVLRDDNFATIVAAVEEGRVIYDNLRRFVSFAVAGNIGKILVMLGWPVPYLLSGGEVDAAVALLPLQLLWLNLMTDGLLGLSMGVEPAEKTVMQRPPQHPHASLWTGGLGRQTAAVGVLIGVAALAVGFAYKEADAPEWQTMIFTSLAFLQVFQAFGTRSNLHSLRSVGWHTNRVMLAIAAMVVGLQLAALYTPLREFLDLESLGLLDLLLCVGLGVTLLVVLEAAKWRRRRQLTPAGVTAGTA
jgi:Ca2+-transporting ATPase